jgi:hypothetical protein
MLSIRLSVIAFLPSPQYSDTVKRIQDQQILIATDDGGACPRIGRQHDIVVAVATHWRLERIRRDQGERLAEQRNGGDDQPAANGVSRMMY